MNCLSVGRPPGHYAPINDECNKFTTIHIIPNQPVSNINDAVDTNLVTLQLLIRL